MKKKIDELEGLKEVLNEITFELQKSNVLAENYKQELEKCEKERREYKSKMNALTSIQDT